MGKEHIHSPQGCLYFGKFLVDLLDHLRSEIYLIEWRTNSGDTRFFWRVTYNLGHFILHFVVGRESSRQILIRIKAVEVGGVQFQLKDLSQLLVQIGG